jgi:hypothetical protein
MTDQMLTAGPVELYESERRAGRTHEEALAATGHVFGYNLGSPARAAQLEDLIAPARAGGEREIGATQ